MITPLIILLGCQPQPSWHRILIVIIYFLNVPLKLSNNLGDHYGPVIFPVKQVPGRRRPTAGGAPGSCLNRSIIASSWLTSPSGMTWPQGSRRIAAATLFCSLPRKTTGRPTASIPASLLGTINPWTLASREIRWTSPADKVSLSLSRGW